MCSFKLQKFHMEKLKPIIAGKLQTRAYLAVVSILTKNPFPLIIHCHRVVKSDMKVGEYGGGVKWKKDIKNDGVQIKENKIKGK